MPLPESICAAGTRMTGLNYLKGRDDPVALKEEEYPEWLWRCLDAKKEEDLGEALDEFCTLLLHFLYPDYSQCLVIPNPQK